MSTEIVYKYRPACRSVDLRSCTIRLTPPGEFNDPFEALPGVSGAWSADAVTFMETEMHRLAAADGTSLDPSAVLAELAAADELAVTGGADWVNRAANEIFGVVSLCARWESGLMWGHYADSHRGFVVGFDACHPWFDTRTTENDPNNHLVPVKYAKTRPNVFLSDLIAGKTDDERAAALFLTKDRSWRYEREVRLVRRLDGADIRDSGHYLLRYPAELVQEVIFGHRMSYSDRAELFDILDNPRYRHVNRYQATLDHYRYSMGRR